MDLIPFILNIYIDYSPVNDFIHWTHLPLDLKREILRMLTNDCRSRYETIKRAQYYCIVCREFYDILRSIVPKLRYTVIERWMTDKVRCWSKYMIVIRDNRLWYYAHLVNSKNKSVRRSKQIMSAGRYLGIIDEKTLEIYKDDYCPLALVCKCDFDYHYFKMIKTEIGLIVIAYDRYNIEIMFRLVDNHLVYITESSGLSLGYRWIYSESGFKRISWCDFVNKHAQSSLCVPIISAPMATGTEIDLYHDIFGAVSAYDTKADRIIWKGDLRSAQTVIDCFIISDKGTVIDLLTGDQLFKDIKNIYAIIRDNDSGYIVFKNPD